MLPRCSLAAGIPLDWQHFLWAAHVHYALRVSNGLRRALDKGTSFNLVRHVLPPPTSLAAAPRQQLVDAHLPPSRQAGRSRNCLPGVTAGTYLPKLAEPLKPGMAHLCPRRTAAGFKWHTAPQKPTST